MAVPVVAIGSGVVGGGVVDSSPLSDVFSCSLYVGDVSGAMGYVRPVALKLIVNGAKLGTDAVAVVVLVLDRMPVFITVGSGDALPPVLGHEDDGDTIDDEDIVERAGGGGDRCGKTGNSGRELIGGGERLGGDDDFMCDASCAPDDDN